MNSDCDGIDWKKGDVEFASKVAVECHWRTGSLGICKLIFRIPMRLRLIR